MKSFTKITAATLATAMILAVTSCVKSPEATEAVTEASETETEETTTSETTTEETTTETTEETTEETDAVSAVEGDMFDLEEYPFDISVDTYSEVLDKIGSDVYYETDDFMAVIDGIKNGDSKAMDKYNDGIAIVCSGDEVFEFIDAFGNPSTPEDVEFNEYLTGLGLFTAADPGDDNYQVVVMYYEFEDPAVVSEWYDATAARFVDGIEDVFPSTDDYETELALYENGDANALIATCIFTDATCQKFGYPEHSGSFIAFYKNGNRCVYITVVDFSDDAAGITMMDDFCDTMGLMNPQDI